MEERKSFNSRIIFYLFSKTLTFLTVLCLLVFFASFGFKDSRTSGWYQQWFPNMNGSTITSMTFLDSLTGYAVTSTNSSVQAYILKTTNGGDNWNIIYTYVPPSTNSGFRKIQFANSNTGFASTNYTNFFKTTNAGLNWIDLSSVIFSDDDMAVINADTILAVSSSGLDGGVFRSTNGGLNWQALGPTGGSGQPNIIYMFNKDIGFSDDNSVGSRMKKTTNGGVNWTLLAPNESFADIKLIDSLTGWKCSGDIKKTTDGGINWNLQQLPQLFSNNMINLSISNINKQWGVGGFTVINNKAYGIMYKSTNGGINWGYQLADTSIHIVRYWSVNFINNNIGWAYATSTGVHTTTNGSDTTFYTGINNISQSPPKNFELKQNYPNPYNNSSLIEYYLNESGWVKLKIFDITGREMATLINEEQNTGGYGIPIAIQLSSGVYFYKLVYINRKGEMQMETKKMVLLK